MGAARAKNLCVWPRRVAFDNSESPALRIDGLTSISDAAWALLNIFDAFLLGMPTVTGVPATPARNLTSEHHRDEKSRF